MLRHLEGWTCPFLRRVSIVIGQGTTVRIESSHSQAQFKGNLIVVPVDH
jgi:hypothetical protein